MRHFALTVLLLAACQDGGAGQMDGAATLVDAPEFPTDSAFALLRHQVALGPRAPGTEPHRAQLAWMADYLRARADTVVVQRFEHTPNDGGAPISMANVFARFAPENPTRILLAAHWDTRPSADNEGRREDRERPIPGANDGASGVAVLLALAQVLAAHAPPIGVDLLLTDGEDFGPGEMYLGAEHFAAQPVPGAGYRPLYGVLVDMVGDKEPRFPQEDYSRERAPEVVDRIWRLAHDMGLGGYFPMRNQGAISDDHVALNDAGIRTANIIDFDYGPGNRFWHTQEDDLANVGPEGLEVVGRVLLQLIYRGG